MRINLKEKMRKTNLNKNKLRKWIETKNENNKK